MKNLGAYFEAAKARRKKELTDRLNDLSSRIEQAKSRKEYYTTLELRYEYQEAQKELKDLH